MCLIAHRPIAPKGKGSNIPNAVIEAAFERHPDGFGVAYRQNGKLVSEKFLPTERDAFRAALKRVDALEVEYAAHWRFATHGPKDRDHAHPYEYVDPDEGRVLVFHNGIIDIRTSKAESDTEVFVRDVLASLPSGWWRDPALRFLVASSIGYSKLIVMTDAETVTINEGMGKWDGGLWYSSTHKAYTVPYGSYTSKAPVGPKGWVALPATTPENAYLPDKGQSRCMVGPAIYSQGHRLDVLRTVKRGGKDCAVKRAVRCTVCLTTGDTYRLEGTLWHDISHLANTPDDDALFGNVGLPA